MQRFLIFVILLVLLAACGPNTQEPSPTSGSLPTPQAAASPSASTPDATPTLVAAQPDASSTPTAEPSPAATPAPAMPTMRPAAPQAAIIFQSLTDGSVQSIDATSGTTLVLGDPTQPEQRLPWSASPNGQTIALVSGRWDEKAGRIERASLWTVAVNGTNPRKLLDLVTAPVDQQFADMQQALTGERFQTLAWTPDSSTILVESAHEGQADLYAVAADGSSIQRLTQTLDLEFQASVAPGGSAVAFGSAASFGTGAGWSNPGAWRMALSGGMPSSIISPEAGAAVAATEIAGWVGNHALALTYDPVRNGATLWAAGENTAPQILSQSVGTILWDLSQNTIGFVANKQEDQTTRSYLWSWNGSDAEPTLLTAIDETTRIEMSPVGAAILLCTGANQQSLKLWNGALQDLGPASCAHVVWSESGQVAIGGATSDAPAQVVDVSAAETEQLPSGARPVGWNGPAFYFFTPLADNTGWQLYQRSAGTDEALGNPTSVLPTNARLITSDTPLPIVTPTNTPQPTATPEPTNPPPAEPTPEPTPPPSAGMEELHGRLQSLIEGWTGEHAVSVTDLQSGQTISVNGARPQLAACTVKIVLMMAVAQDIEAGRYTKADVASLVRATMGPSYTPPARELLQIVGDGDIGAGIRRVNEIMWSLGATKSILTHPPGYYWEEYGYAASHGTSENRLTTDDLNLILSKLYRGEALSAWATDYVLNSMTIAPDWMDQALGSPLPAGSKLYHKIGQLYEPENTWNDAGIVVFERGGTRYAYAISYMGSYGPTWQDSYTHATSLSAATWRYFSATYQ